jgi:hypothetical protein
LRGRARKRVKRWSNSETVSEASLTLALSQEGEGILGREQSRQG